MDGNAGAAGTKHAPTNLVEVSPGAPPHPLRLRVDNDDGGAVEQAVEHSGGDHGIGHADRLRFMIEIRTVHPEEYEEAGRVTASAWEPWDDPSYVRFFAYLRDVASRVKVAPVFVAVDNGAILGSVTLEMHERLPEFGQEHGPLPLGEAHVRSLGVAPSARRSGVGRKLMLHCIDFARSNGKTVMTLNTGDENIPAQRLYESMGFRRGPDLVVQADFSPRSYQLNL